MKPIFLSSKSSHQDILTYGKDLFEKIVQQYNGAVYDTFKADFSDVPELFSGEEKIVLFNHFAMEGGFRSLTKHLPSFRNVKYLLSPYSSYNGLDLKVVKELGIHYRNNAGANAKAVAQYAIACMFSLLSRFPELGKLKEMPDGSILGEEYHSKTAGIIGMGNVGKELAATLQQLGIPTTYYNRTEKNVDAKLVALNEVFKQDVIFIVLATNPETKKLLAGIRDLVQSHNYIVDVSGYDDLYDKQGIVEILNDGKIKGYALEADGVFTSDKNFISTPGIAWCTVDAEKRTVNNYLHRAQLILEGKALQVDFIV